MLKRQYMRELFWEKSMLYNISDCLNAEKHSLHGKPMQADAFIETFSVFYAKPAAFRFSWCSS